jgi:DNA-binding MarR family transcriptional regulator
MGACALLPRIVGQGRAAMGELSRRMMVTTGNVTALVDRLEAEC